MAEPRLYLKDSSGAQSIVPFTPPTLTLGRSSTNHVVVNDPSVSRFHAEIRQENGEFLIADKSSKNGTLVNGERVQEHKLSHGDQIQLGTNPILTMVFALRDLDGPFLSIVRSSTELESSKVSAHHLKMLLDVSKALNSSLILDDVLNRVIDAVIELSGADRGFLMLKDSKGELQFTVARNMSHESLQEKQYRLSRSVIQRVIETDQSVIVTDSDRDQDLREQKSIILLNLKTILCVPLKIYRSDPLSTGVGKTPFTTIGLLYVDKQTVTHFFSDQDRELLETLAGHAAVAIENARLFQEAIEKRRLEEEMKIASEIQQTLLPKAPPQTQCLRFAATNIPCRAIGGDYYDFFPMGENSVGVVIADVAGKGASAALLTSMVQGIFLAEASPEKSVAETVSRVNHLLTKKNPSGKFVTVFYGVFSGDGRFSYCNAGHNPPLWFNAEGTVQELKEGGMVLGVFDNVPFAQAEVRLSPGDRLVLFTDGVTEARSSTEEDFGEERLVELVQKCRAQSADEMKYEIMTRLGEFTAGVLQHDDITLIVAEWLN